MIRELVLSTSGIVRLLGALGLLSVGITLTLWGLKRRRSGAISSLQCPRPRLVWRMVSLLLVISLWIPQLVTAEDPVEILTPRYVAEGRYALVAGGVGLAANPGPGDISLTISGTVVQAYLYWSAVDVSPGGDNIVSLAVDGVTTTVTATDTYGPVSWAGSNYRYLYVGDVTSLVQAGTYTYTVSDFDDTIYRRDGAGLMVVYEDPSVPYQRLEIRDGLDRFFRPWWDQPPDNPQRGETAISCYEFESSPTDRQMDIIMFVSGVSIRGAPRPNALWYRTGTATETIPTDMIFENDDTRDPLAVMLHGPPPDGNYPFNSVDGSEWDTYTNSVPIPVGATWVCIQVESLEYLSYLPASGVGTSFGTSLEEVPPTPTPVPPTPTPVPPTSEPPETEVPPIEPPTATSLPEPTATPLPEPTATPLPESPTPLLTPLPGSPTPPPSAGSPTPTFTPLAIPPTPVIATLIAEILTIETLPETGGLPRWFTVVLGVPIIIGAVGLLNLALLEMKGRRGGRKGG